MNGQKINRGKVKEQEAKTIEEASVDSITTDGFKDARTSRARAREERKLRFRNVRECFNGSTKRILTCVYWRVAWRLAEGGRKWKFSGLVSKVA